MDLDYTHRRMMSALAKIADGAELADYVPIQNQGREVQVRSALINGARFLCEPFHDDHWDIVMAAFSRFGMEPPSRQKDECCRSLLEHMSTRAGPM
jgi:hypothetical protein